MVYVSNGHKGKTAQKSDLRTASVVGPIRSTSIMKINKAVIRSLSTSFTTFEESEWKNRSRKWRVCLSRNCRSCWSRLVSGVVDANTSILFLIHFLACWRGHHGTP